MRWKSVLGDKRAALIHNPKHFYSNSFERDVDSLGREVVKGRARGPKNFKIVAILKPNTKPILRNPTKRKR